ncbi:MAG: hypothetical protein RLZZ306_2016 [Bacteroidota bacterium]
MLMLMIICIRFVQMLMIICIRFVHKIYIFTSVLNKNLLEMLFKRNLEKYIFDWKEKTKRKPLIIRGARQVGKTTLVEKVGQNYDIFISFS